MLDAIERRNTAVRRVRGSTLTLSRDRVSRLVIHTYEPCKPTASIPEKAQPPPCCSARLEEVAEAGVIVDGAAADIDASTNPDADGDRTFSI